MRGLSLDFQGYRKTIFCNQLGAIASFVSSFVLCSGSFGNEPAITVRTKAEEGLKLYSSGKFSEAAQAFEQGTEKAAANSEDGTILKFNQACSLRAAGDTGKAKALFLDVASGPNKQLASSAHHNLALIAADEAKQLLGQDPLALPDDKRKAVVERLNASLSLYRDSLRADANNSDARHNLELLRLFIQELEKNWLESDLQKRREGKDLFQFLEFMDQQLSQASAGTLALNSRKTKVSRLERTRLAEAQKKLLDEFEPLKTKIDSALQSSKSDAEGKPTDLSVEEKAKVQQIQGVLNELVSRSQQSVANAGNSIQSGDFQSAIQHQQSARDRLNELFQGMAPFPQLLQRAITDQQSLLDLNQQTDDASSLKEDNGLEVDLVGQAWRQNWITQFSSALSPRAGSMLLSLPEKPDAEGLRAEIDADLSSERTSNVDPEVSVQQETSNDVEPTLGDTVEVSPIEDKDSVGMSTQSTEKETMAALRRALEKAIETTPEIVTHSKKAADNLSQAISVVAESEQQEVLRMLKEIADLLPKPPQDQRQDQQQDKSQTDQNQSDKNQQKQNNKNNQEHQEKSNESNRSDTEKSKSPDRQESENQEEKQTKEKDSGKEPEQDLKDDRSTQPKQESRPTDEMQGTEKAQPTEPALQRKLAEQRAQTILRRIREREAKYRELLEQLREIQSRQQPVAKDW